MLRPVSRFRKEVQGAGIIALMIIATGKTVVCYEKVGNKHHPFQSPGLDAGRRIDAVVGLCHRPAKKR